MTSLSKWAAVGVSAVLLAQLMALPAHGSTEPVPCTIAAKSSGGWGGVRGIVVDGVCRPAGSGSGGGSAGPVTKAVDCGTASLDGKHWNTAVCGPNQRACYAGRARTLVPTFATVIRDPASGRWILQSIWCPGTAKPGPSLAAIRDQAMRLLPAVGIGTAPRATTLVNIQTIVWAATAARRDLGTVRVVGQPVRLRLNVAHAQWNFGDHTAVVTTNPGVAYDPDRNPCRSAQCPGYFGHTYGATGHDTITLTIDWHASFSLDGTTWTDVDPNPLTGPTSTAAITVRQARAVLVRAAD